MNPAIDLRLPSAPEAAGQARRAVEGLSGWFRPGLLDEIRLLVSELVTNSYKHGRAGSDGWIGLHIETRSNTIRVEVCDAGAGFDPKTLLPSGGEESGWGLFLVRRIADRWGVTPGVRCCVWFELPLEAPAENRGN